MINSPVLALRKALRDALLADASLTASLGSGKIHDEAPRGAQLPYVTFGDAQVRDWSTTTDHAVEQTCIVDVWSGQRGLSEALAIAAMIRALVDDAALAAEGWGIANLRFVAMESRREGNGRFARVSLRFRAAMESI